MFSKTSLSIPNFINNSGLNFFFASNPDLTDNEVDEMIKQSGGIDFEILGIGRNEHIGFNQPDSELDANTHLTSLTESTIEANSVFFESRDKMPTQALTMGIGSILSAKTIIIMANGESKKAAVEKLVNGNITTSLPASLLKVHPDVILICDKAAYSLVK